MATPQAPTNLVEDNILRIVSFTLNLLYAIGDHEFSLNAGSTWTDCTSSTISIPTGFYNLDDIQIRVKAIGGDTASATLNNILGYLSPLIQKPLAALKFDIVLTEGQSNMAGVTNNVNNLEADGISWENGIPKDWQTEGNGNFKGSLLPAFMNRHFKLTGRKCIVVFADKGGTALQYIPESDVNGNWSENGGTLRYDAAKEVLPCIEYFNQDLGYNINSVIVLFDQGENDAGSIALGYTSTPANYRSEFKSLAQYNNEAFGMDQLYVSLLGSLVDYDDETEMAAIREEGQRQSSVESNLITVAYEDSTNFPNWGQMHDGVHHERQGQDSKGTRMAEVVSGADPLPNVDVKTTEFMDLTQYTTYLQFDDEFLNGVVGADEYTLEGGATIESSSSRFTYGKGLSIPGDGTGFLKIAQSPIKHDSYTIACRVRIPARFSNGNNCLFGDMSNLSGNIVSGCALAGFNGALLTFWVNNKGVQWAGADSDLIIDNDWHDVVVSVDFTLLVPKATLYLDGVSYGSELIAASPFVTDWSPATQEFTIGCCDAMGLNAGGTFSDKINAFEMDDFRIDNKVWLQAEATLYTTSASDYDLANIPVTPAAPTDDSFDLVLRIFSFVLNPLYTIDQHEISLNYGVTFSEVTSTDIYWGDATLNKDQIVVRVKVIGVNYPSLELKSKYQYDYSPSIANFSSLRSKIRRETLDTPGVRWTDEELDKYINVAQEVYARRTGHLKGEEVYYHDGVNFIYETPADYIAASGFVLPDDSKTNIQTVEWKFIAETNSPKWLVDQSDRPKSIVFDYEGWNRFRLYPNTDKDDGALLGTLKYSRLPVENVLEIQNIQTLCYYVLFRSYLKERGGRYLAKAQKYKKLFEKDLQKYKSRSTGTLLNKAGFRKVRTF